MNANESDILDCQFEKWIEIFHSKTFKYKIIYLPQKFIEYLLGDGIHLPSEVTEVVGNDEISDDEDLVEIEYNEDENHVSSAPDFSEITSQLKKAIIDLKGEVFVKLNWCSPLDATWINSGTLKCSNTAEIYLLLKSSDRIVFDIEHMFDLCDTTNTGITPTTCKKPYSPELFTLVIKKWANLNPAMEFRMFIGNGKILGKEIYGKMDFKFIIFR